MLKIVHVILKLPDSRFIFQRRTKDAKINPGMLGFFGGHIEEGESPLQAIKREVEEETSLDVGKLKFTQITNYGLSADILNSDEPRKFYLFIVEVPNTEFKIYEGARAEAYGREEALHRNDLLESVRYALENKVEKWQ